MIAAVVFVSSSRIIVIIPTNVRETHNENVKINRATSVWSQLLTTYIYIIIITYYVMRFSRKRLDEHITIYACNTLLSKSKRENSLFFFLYFSITHMYVSERHVTVTLFGNKPRFLINPIRKGIKHKYLFEAISSFKTV